MTIGWRKLHNEEVRDLYSSPSIIRISKSRRTKRRWAGHVAQMGGGEEDRVDVGVWIPLRGTLYRWNWVVWTGLVWLRRGTDGELL
jgi:hypothetical protein